MDKTAEGFNSRQRWTNAKQLCMVKLQHSRLQIISGWLPAKFFWPRTQPANLFWLRQQKEVHTCYYSCLLSTKSYLVFGFASGQAPRRIDFWNSDALTISYRPKHSTQFLRIFYNFLQIFCTLTNNNNNTRTFINLSICLLLCAAYSSDNILSHDTRTLGISVCYRFSDYFLHFLQTFCTLAEWDTRTLPLQNFIDLYYGFRVYLHVLS